MLRYRPFTYIIVKWFGRTVYSWTRIHIVTSVKKMILYMNVLSIGIQLIVTLGGAYCFNPLPPPPFISTHPSLNTHRTPPLLSVLCNVPAFLACFVQLISKYSISISLISCIKHCNQNNCAKLSEIKCIPLSYISFELSLRESLKGGLGLRKPWRNMEIKKKPLYITKSFYRIV